VQKNKKPKTASGGNRGKSLRQIAAKNRWFAGKMEDTAGRGKKERKKKRRGGSVPDAAN